jgi:hypothetical protein
MARLVDNMKIGTAIGKELDDQVLPHQACATGYHNLCVSQMPGIGLAHADSRLLSFSQMLIRESHTTIRKARPISPR